MQVSQVNNFFFDLTPIHAVFEYRKDKRATIEKKPTNLNCSIKANFPRLAMLQMATM